MHGTPAVPGCDDTLIVLLHNHSVGRYEASADTSRYEIVSWSAAVRLSITPLSILIHTGKYCNSLLFILVTPWLLIASIMDAMSNIVIVTLL